VRGASIVAATDSVAHFAPLGLREKFPRNREKKWQIALHAQPSACVYFAEFACFSFHVVKKKCIKVILK